MLQLISALEALNKERCLEQPWPQQIAMGQASLILQPRSGSLWALNAMPYAHQGKIQHIASLTCLW